MRFIAIFIFVVAGLLTPSECKIVSAAVIYESGTLGQTGVTRNQLLDQTVTGSNVASFNFVGARFQVPVRCITTRIGGHFGGGFQVTDFFAAIVRLTSDLDFPDSGDLATPDVLGVALMTFPDPSAEAFGNVAVNLDPGSYAVVFGSGLFGTNGRGVAVANGTDIGDPNYILWQPGNGWLDMPPIFSNYRFVVEGNFVPEPPSLPLSLLAIAGPFVVLGRRNR